MSEISCSACNDLREYAPNFVQNGVIDGVAASLINNTGFNPALTVLHKNCEDLNDANDCLIGRMGDELEAYDVCDWKKFMGKYIPNNYELLKAMIAGACGQWEFLEKLCSTVDTLKNLIVPKPLTAHKMTMTDVGHQRIRVKSPLSQSGFHFTLLADIFDAAGCRDETKYGAVGLSYAHDDDTYPPSLMFDIENIQIGDNLAYIRKEQVVPDYMTEEQWNANMFTGGGFDILGIDGVTKIRFSLYGYIVYNGVEYNTALKNTFGPDVMVLHTNSIFGPQNVRSGTGYGYGDFNKYYVID